MEEEHIEIVKDVQDKINKLSDAIPHYEKMIAQIAITEMQRQCLILCLKLLAGEFNSGMFFLEVEHAEEPDKTAIIGLGLMSPRILDTIVSTVNRQLMGGGVPLRLQIVEIPTEKTP